MLKRGSKGPAVKTLQQNLHRLGYALVADGDFGPATEATVIMFQRKYRIGVDGIVGPVTLAAIKKSIERTYPKPGPVKPPASRPWESLFIVLDCQHIGKPAPNDHDRGATGNGLVEAGVVSLIHDAAEHLLTADGHRVARMGDHGVKGTYHERNDWANEHGVQLYIAGHLNAGGGQYSLVETASSAGADAKRFAELLLDGYSVAFKERTVYKHIGFQQRGDVCTRRCKMPAVINEPLFIDTPRHAAWLKTEEGRLKIATAIRNAVRAYAKK